jgi:PKD domain/WD40-like Beta Propeller Repeat
MKRVILVIGTLLILLPLAMGQDYYKVRKQTRISSKLDEAAAVPYEEGVVYITESNSVGASSPTDQQGRKLYTIYLMEKGGRKKPFREELVSQKHEGPVSFTADYKTMVFSQQRPVVGSRVDPLGLYFADKDEAGVWVNERAFEFNDREAWLFSPTLSGDGRTLYFSANYEGGQGGFDIYRSKLRGGAWTKPENLGPAVNSSGNELYPFIHPLGKLYFSTDGRDKKLGDYDIFMTALVNGKWMEAIKLDPPLNSRAGDYQLWFSENFKEGYLTSTRRGGSKDIYEISTEIPEFTAAEPIKKTYYKYRILDRKLDTVDTKLFRYSWLINDTLEIPGHDIIYEFPDTGTYHLELRVFDIQLDTLLESQTFKTLPIRLKEQAVITCPDTIIVGAEVEFDGRNTFLPGFDDFSYVWDFGDGSFGQGKVVSHTFLYPGSFRVTLGVQARPKNRRDIPEMHSNFRNIIVVDSVQ